MNDPRGGLWSAIGQVMTAHAVMLRDAGLVDDRALAMVLRGVDATRAGTPPERADPLALVTAFDERATSLAPVEAGGVLHVGRGDLDVAVTALRLVARDDLLGLGHALDRLRERLLELARVHTVTLLPATIDGQAAQPTSFAHLLGGVIGPLGRAAARLREAFSEIDRSPMGAGSLASSGLAIDRERVAELLGFEGVVENTFDAVSSWDAFAASAEAVAAAIRPTRRLFEELLVWTRLDPALVVSPAGTERALGDLPQVRLPAALTGAVAEALAAERTAEALRTKVAGIPYGPYVAALEPLAAGWMETIAAAEGAVAGASAVLERIELNRALLANRAGRGFVTSSDLADFLMLEEQIDPGAARAIAALTIARTREQGLEASGITPGIIDGAALFVIGREIGAEFEAISRYLAPRRFLERRTATGAPSPAATRAYLEGESARVSADRAARAAAHARIKLAATALAEMEHEARDAP